MDTAKNALKTYERTITDALGDQIIDDEEKQILLDIEEKLLSDTYFTALEDRKIDDDELLLLKTLIKTIDPNASISWLDEDKL